MANIERDAAVERADLAEAELSNVSAAMDADDHDTREDEQIARAEDWPEPAEEVKPWGER